MSLGSKGVRGLVAIPAPTSGNCFTWQKQGGCGNGDKCPYQHLPEEKNPAKDEGKGRGKEAGIRLQIARWKRVLKRKAMVKDAPAPLHLPSLSIMPQSRQGQELLHLEGREQRLANIMYLESASMDRNAASSTHPSVRTSRQVIANMEKIARTRTSPRTTRLPPRPRRRLKVRRVEELRPHSS